ncbi:glycoside hydrolase family 9 protein [Hirschia litorea]|uniref:Endoglucanase n=1 Tax=Hirschia litorea TaxID=1199156 RepID=A0ABW2IQ53_9PROT
MKISAMGALSLTLIAALNSPESRSENNSSSCNVTRIFLNQVGYETTANKRATISSPFKTPINWELKDETGTIVLTGHSNVLGYDNLSGFNTHSISFSQFKNVGTNYRLHVCDQASEPFNISPTPFAALAEDSLRFFYLMRSGTPISKEYAILPQYARPAGHPSSQLSCFIGRDRTKTKWKGCKYELNVVGGWYDAGDYGKYVVNGALSAWTLQNAYERLNLLGGADKLGWDKNRVPLPEKNDLSPLLNEARWEMEFLLKMQVPDGYKTQAALGLQNVTKGKKIKISEINGSGLVHHKVHENQWLGMPLRPEDANQKRYLYPVSTAATLNLAASAAQCARIWKSIDPEFSNQCLTAAVKAYQAAKNNPDIYAYDIFEGGGGYEDSDLSDEFAWAAFELFSTTGNSEYIKQLKDTPGKDWLIRYKNNQLKALYWANTDILPLLTILVSPHAYGAKDTQQASEKLVSIADTYLSSANNNSFLIPLDASEFNWGSNGALLNKAMILAYAGEITENPVYRNAVINVMNYLLGNNPLSQSYIAGYGSTTLKNAHHRFWAAAIDKSLPATAPGSLSGGPNVKSAVDEVAQALLKACQNTPMTCWKDDYKAYSLNEVAINWNAPLTWVTSYIETSLSYASTTHP